jgi:hypothetical protein
MEHVQIYYAARWFGVVISYVHLVDGLQVSMCVTFWDGGIMLGQLQGGEHRITPLDIGKLRDAFQKIDR